MRKYKIVYVGGCFSAIVVLVAFFSVIAIPLALMMMPEMYEIVEVSPA